MWLDGHKFTGFQLCLIAEGGQKKIWIENISFCAMDTKNLHRRANPISTTGT